MRKIRDADAERINIIVLGPMMKRINEWRGRQPDVPNVSEAIRRLIDLGLERDAPKKGRRG